MGLAADVIAIRRRSLVVEQHGRRYRDFGRRLGSICYADLLQTQIIVARVRICVMALFWIDLVRAVMACALPRCL